MSLRTLFKGNPPAYELAASRGASNEVLHAPASGTGAATWGAIPTPTPPQVSDIPLAFAGGTVGPTGCYLWQTGLTRHYGQSAIHQSQYQLWVPNFSATGLQTSGGDLVATVAGSNAPAGTTAIVEIETPAGEFHCLAASLTGTTLTYQYADLNGATEATFTSATFTWWVNTA